MKGVLKKKPGSIDPGFICWYRMTGYLKLITETELPVAVAVAGRGLVGGATDEFGCQIPALLDPAAQVELGEVDGFGLLRSAERFDLLAARSC